MTENATEEMKAMARRCAEKAYHEGYDTMTAMMLAKRAALAAIIEATEKCAELAYGHIVSGNTKWCEGADTTARKIATAIRSGKQYGKE